MGRVRALVKDANMTAFVLVECAEVQTFAVPISDADRDRLAVSDDGLHPNATFEIVAGAKYCVVTVTV